MFDMQGNVIGINNAIFSPTGGSVGIGFAIPAEIAAPIVEQADERARRSSAAISASSIQPLNEDLADSLGLAAQPRRVRPVGRARPGRGQRAGIKPGDVVVKVDGKDVTRDQTLSFIVANIAPGKRIPIELIRDGKRRT